MTRRHTLWRVVERERRLEPARVKIEAELFDDGGALDRR